MKKDGWQTESAVWKRQNMKQSFEQSQQSQVRLFESFKSRAQLDKEESLDESENPSCHPQQQFQQNFSSNFQFNDTKNPPYPSTSLASKNSSAKKEKSTESNTLPTATGGAASKKNRDNNIMGIVCRVGDNDSPMGRDNLDAMSKSTSTVGSREKKKTENNQIEIGKRDKVSLKAEQKEHILDSNNDENDAEEVSAKDSNENNPDNNFNGHEDVVDLNKINHNPEEPLKSPVNKAYGRRGSRRVPAANLSGQITKDQLNTASVKEPIASQPKSTGGFFLAMKLKKYANQMVSRLQSRRYLSLRSRHLQFFNDETIVPDEEKGVFKHQSSHHGDEGFEELGSADVAQSINKQCTFFLIKLYNKHFSKEMKIAFNKIPLFSPSHTVKLLWDFLNMISIAYYLIFFPLRIAFGLSLYSNPISFIAVILIQFDILVHLNTGFYDKGALVNDRIHILMHYLGKRFITDILTMIPFLVYGFSGSHDNLLSTFPKLLESAISLLFLIRVSHLSQIKKKIEERFYQKKTLTHIFSLFSLLMNTLYIAHIFSCAWIIVAEFKLSSDNTWMNQANVDESDWTTQYIYSLYFLIITMTTVGYGDIRAQNSVEHVLIIVIVLISSGVFSFSINQIGSIVQQMSEEKEKVKKTLQVINNYMNKKNINMSLQQQIREYLEYYLKESLMNDNDTEDKIIEMLSEPLKRSLMIEANKIALKDSPIFRNNFSETTITKTVAVIQELRCTPEEVLFYEGDTDTSAIFFVQQGKVELFIDAYNSTSGEVQITSLKAFSKGSSFGEISFFTGSPRNISIRSIDFTTLLMIKRQDFLSIVKDQSDDYENFCRIKDSIIFYKSFDDLGIKCISCNSKNHVLNDCPLIHYVPNTEKIIKVFQLPCLMERQECDTDDRVDKYNCWDNRRQIDDEARLFMANNLGFVEDQDWYDGNAEDEEEMDVYQQYEDDDDDEDEDGTDIDRNNLKQLQSQTGGTINEGKHYHKQSTHDQLGQVNVHTSPLREDSQIPRTNQEIGNINLNMNNNNNNNANGSVYGPSVNNLGSFIQGNSSSSVIHLNSQNNNITIANGSTGLTNPMNNLLITNLNSNNNFDKFSQGGYKLEVEDINNNNNNRRERNSSNLGLNDLALTPSGLILNLINPNPGQIKENTNKGNNNTIKESSQKGGQIRESSQKGVSIQKRNRSVSNNNINNLVVTTPNYYYKKSSTLQNEDPMLQQQSLPMLQQQQQAGDRGLSLGGMNNTIERGGTGVSHQPSMSKNGSQQVRKQSRRKNTEKTLRTNNKRQSTKMTIDSRMNNGANGGGGFNERRQLKQLTVLRKGLQENQIQNTLLALQGMENILLQNKQSSSSSNEFDIMKCFSIYFPHNNMDIVIFQLRKQNPHLYAKQKSLAKSNTKKLFGGMTMNSMHNRMSKMDIVYQKFLMSEVDEEKDKDSQQSARLKSFTGHKSDFYKTPKLQPTTINNPGNNGNSMINSRKHSVQVLNENINGSPLYFRTKSKTMKANPINNDSQQQLNYEEQSHDFSPKQTKKRLIRTPPPPKGHFEISDEQQQQQMQMNQDHLSPSSMPKQILKRHENVDYGVLPAPPEEELSDQDNQNQNNNDESNESHIDAQYKAQMSYQQHLNNQYYQQQQQQQQHQYANSIYRIASGESRNYQVEDPSHKNVSFQDDNLVQSNLEL